MSVCRTVSDIFIVKEWRDLEIKGTDGSRSLKMAPFDRDMRLSIGRPMAIVSIAVYVVPFASYLTSNNRDFEKVTEGHLNWYHSKAWVRFPIHLP